jgi:hypothetical protein
MNVCGHPYNSEIRSYVPGLGMRSPASISRYSRTLTPINQAARQTLSPSRFRFRCIIPGNEATLACDEGYPVALTSGTLAPTESNPAN